MRYLHVIRSVRQLVIPVLLLAAMLGGGAVWAQSQTVTVEGVAGILGGDQGIARDNAIRDAQRKAVEQAVGTMIASETLVENFQVLRDSVYSKSQGYIQKYDIVKEGAQKDLYSVTISATVATGNLKNDLSALGLLIARVGKPRILFMIAEQNIGQQVMLYWWSVWGKGGAAFAGQNFDMAVSETVLKEDFLAKGFNVVDISSATGRFDISNAYRVADLTSDGARTFGKKLNAEVVIMGKALAKEGPRAPGSTVGAYLADITLSAIRVDNGQVLASARGEGVARHIMQQTGGSQALEKAARGVGEKLITQITAKWTAETTGGQLVRVTIHGVTLMKDLVTIKDFLQSQVRGVQSVIQRDFEDGTAVLELDAKVTAQQVGDEIARKELKGLDLEVVSATANTIEICLHGICPVRGVPTAPAPAPPPAPIAPPPQVAAVPAPEPPPSPVSAGQWIMENDKLIITADELNVGKDRVTLYLTYTNKTSEVVEVVLLGTTSRPNSSLDDSAGDHYLAKNLSIDEYVMVGSATYVGNHLVKVPPKSKATVSVAFHPKRLGVKKGTTFSFASEQAYVKEGESLRGARNNLRQGEKFQVAIRNIEMR